MMDQITDPQPEQTLPVLTADPNISPEIDALLKQKIAIPYVTTIPTNTPPQGTRVIYYDGTDYWLYVYANSGWRTTKLDGNGFPSGGAQGDTLYHNGTSWVRLAAGTSGNFLKTLGAGANPAWAAVPSFALAGHAHTQGSATGVANTDVTIQSFTIPAMAANDALYVQAHGFGGGGTQTWKLKLGTVELFSLAVSPNNIDYYFSFTVMNRNSTSSQITFAMYTLQKNVGGGNTTTYQQAVYQTSAATTTSSATLALTIRDIANGNPFTSEYLNAYIIPA